MNTHDSAIFSWCTPLALSRTDCNYILNLFRRYLSSEKACGCTASEIYFLVIYKIILIWILSFFLYFFFFLSFSHHIYTLTFSSLYVCPPLRFRSLSLSLSLSVSVPLLTLACYLLVSVFRYGCLVVAIPTSRTFYRAGNSLETVFGVTAFVTFCPWEEY